MRHHAVRWLCLALLAFAGAAAAQDRFVVCEACHLGIENLHAEPGTGAIIVPKVEPVRFADSLHVGVACQDCHVRGYDSLPHHDIRVRGCVDCHPRTDAAGAAADAAFDFRRLAAEMRESAHFTATRDAFASRTDLRHGIRFTVLGEEDGFRCALCHHPHYMAAPAVTVAERVETENAWCTSCHAGEPERPPNLMLAVEWDALASPAPAGLVAQHAAIPHAERHLDAARCVDCHAPAAEPHSHAVLAGSASATCQACHAPASRLEALWDTGSGERASGAQDEPYVIGATRSRMLDALGLGLLGGVLILILAHLLWRAWRRIREGKR